MGVNCKYSGGNNDCPEVKAYLQDKTYRLICPEQLGGLSIPRPPAEIQGNRVVNAEGKDVTAAFEAGAEAVLALCQELNPEEIILKESSPSCGSHFIYDGTFQGKKIPGQGFTARLLAEHGYRLKSEKEIKNEG